MWDNWDVRWAELGLEGMVENGSVIMFVVENLEWLIDGMERRVLKGNDVVYTLNPPFWVLLYLNELAKLWILICPRYIIFSGVSMIGSVFLAKLIFCNNWNDHVSVLRFDSVIGVPWKEEIPEIPNSMIHFYDYKFLMTTYFPTVPHCHLIVLIINFVYCLYNK